MRNDWSYQTNLSTNSIPAKIPYKTVQPVFDQIHFQKGQLLLGEIIQKTENQLLLELPSGAILPATLQEPISLPIGMQLPFEIIDASPNKLILRPAPNEKIAKEQPSLDSQYIVQALRAASLPIQENTKALVQQLLRQQLPIKKELLQELYRQCIRYPDIPVSSIVWMKQEEIPFTDFFLTSLEQWQTKKSSFPKELLQIIDDFFHSFRNLPNNKINDCFLNCQKQLLSFLVTDLAQSPESSCILPITETMQDDLAKLTVPFTLPSSQNLSTREIFPALQHILSEEKDDVAISFFASPTYGRWLRKQLQHNMAITPHACELEDAFPRFYQRLEQQISLLQTLRMHLQNAEKDATSSLEKQASPAQEQLQWMKALQPYFPFFQLPLNLQEKNITADFYVQRRKKGEDSSQGFHLFFQLNLEHLGPLSIDVRVLQKQVYATFYPVPKQLVFFESNLPRLETALQKQGFSFFGAVKTEIPLEQQKHLLQPSHSDSILKPLGFDLFA